jgi:protein-L-isoaspartate(D-aspartate) O-methyltransferase
MAPHSPNYEEARRRMVEEQIARRGIQDERVLQAMRAVPRHRFLPPDLWGAAYQDHPLPIGYGQTISQPYIVAYMTEMLALTVDDRVLEIGTGSGYQSAVLSRLARQVYTIERIPELSANAQEVLKGLGYCPLTEAGDYRNIQFRVGDGGYGWPEESPFDAIIVTAAAPETPPPLIAQLADGAHLVIPIGPTGYQDLVRVTRRGERIHTEQLTPVAFVPLIGEHGWRGREYDD